MKTTLVLAAVVGLTFGAPAEIISSEKNISELQRQERSYGPPPCSAAAGGYGGAPGGYGGGAPGGYSGGYAPPLPYLPPQLGPPPSPLPGPLPGPLSDPLPQYREEEKHEESHHSGRSYYEPALPPLPAAPAYASGASSSAAASIAGPAPSLAPAPSSPAVGLFPNAKVGGCNVPLLLSCSPQVVTGHLAESHYAAPAYRHVEEPKRDTRNTESSKARVVSHHKVSEDYPEPKEPHDGSHHVVSEDYPKPNLTVITGQPQTQENKEGETKKELLIK